MMIEGSLIFQIINHIYSSEVFANFLNLRYLNSKYRFIYILPSIVFYSIFVIKFLKWLEFHKIYYVNSASFIQQYVIAGYTAYPIIFAFFAIYFKSLSSKYAKIIFCIIFFKKPFRSQNMTDAK